MGTGTGFLVATDREDRQTLAATGMGFGKRCVCVCVGGGFPPQDSMTLD